MFLPPSIEGGTLCSGCFYNFSRRFGNFENIYFCRVWYINRKLLESSFICIKAVCLNSLIEKWRGFKDFQKWVIESHRVEKWVICSHWWKGVFKALLNQPIQDARHTISYNNHEHIDKIRNIDNLEIYNYFAFSY